MMRLTDFPDDILEEIFHAMRGLMCFPGEREDSETYEEGEDAYKHRNAYAPKRVPLWANVLALSHVCAHWRSLMLTRPRLWTFIRVTGSFLNRMMVNEMLDRAGTFPLSILFVHRPHLGNQKSDVNVVYDVLGVASVISDHSSRIGELGIVLNSSQQVALVLDTLGRCPVPRLEKLWLHCMLPNAGMGFATPRTSLLDNAMPPLRVLHAHNISLPWLPYERLVRLELSCGPAPPLAALLHTLRHSPELEVLALRIATARADHAQSSSSHSALDDDEPRAVLPRLRQLRLDVNSTEDAAFSVLPHIAFPPAMTAVWLRFTGRVSSALYEDCTSLEELTSAVRRAELVYRGPGFASLSSVPSRSPPRSPSPTPSHALLPFGAPDSSPTLEIQWMVPHQRWPPHGRRVRPSGSSSSPTPRLCEGFKAIPLPALAELSVVVAPFPGTVEDRDGAGGVAQEEAHVVERFRRLWECVPAVESLELRVHPAQAAQVFASLAARAKEEPELELELEREATAIEGDGFGWDEEVEGEGEKEAEEEEEIQGEIVCPELKRLRVTWWEPPSVDDLWGVERCCLARATAGARLELLETVEFPEVVLTSLRYHVDSVGVTLGA